MPDLSSILLFIAAALFVFGIAITFQKNSVAVTSVRRGGSANWFTANIGRRFRPSEDERQANRLWLLQAGFESPDAAQNYLATRMLLAIALPLVVGTALPFVKPDVMLNTRLMCAVFAAVCGLLTPLIYVQQRRGRNQQAAREGLPDALDLLLVCSEAGLGLDTAILKVGEELAAVHPIISKYFLQVSSELRAGRPRADAFRGFGDRTGIPETTSLVNLLIQTDALGTSISASLRAFAEDMRTHRLLRAEELGQKMTVKLTMILAGLLLPSLFIAILSPVINKVIHTSFRLGQ